LDLLRKGIDLPFPVNDGLDQLAEPMVKIGSLGIARYPRRDF
jgi:hypothetical protein